MWLERRYWPALYSGSEESSQPQLRIGCDTWAMKIGDTHNYCIAIPVFSYANKNEIDGCPHLAAGGL